MNTREAKIEAFGHLLDVQERLRKECPWDRKQTFQSLRPNTIEETFELADALMNNDMHNVKKELGDVMEHVLFYAILGDESDEFDIADVCNQEARKLMFRHPFIDWTGWRDDPKADSGDMPHNSEEVEQTWEQIKQKEKDGNKTVLSGVPASLPSLIKAYRIQDKARGVGFDWEQKEDVCAKVKEEEGELERELRAIDAAESDEARNAAKDRAEDELGDMIFALVNAGRLYKLNPDTALEKTCAKFRRRFTYLEEHTIRQGRDLKDMTLAQMDEIWDEAKKLGL